MQSVCEIDNKLPLYVREHIIDSPINLKFGEVIEVKCALASLGFINENLQHNKQVIIDTLIACSTKADMVIFGEAFLQGFYGATFVVEHDVQIAISQDDLIVREICSVAKQFSIAVSFGFIEKADNCFYSSQITIDENGSVIDLYRRVSSGWKESFANNQYCEGERFHKFHYKEKDIVIGLCGDLWFDENVEKIQQLNPNVVFWPVYTDFNHNEWNNTMKYEYAVQASRFCKTVLYVNSYCKDKEGDEIAKGGSALFQNCEIREEIPSGKEGILFVEI